MFNPEWKQFLAEQVKQPYFDEILKRLDEEECDIFPSYLDVFRVFEYSISDTKVVILGQDPYHKKGQATGLAFSVNSGVKIPPSLRNIFKELKNEGYNCDSLNGDLARWAKQGVFLLNAVLTVREGVPNSHSDFGWQFLTDNTIRVLNEDSNPKVFLLWGNQAQEKESLISNPIHMVLKSTHPSPLSAYRGFLGCQHFRLANEFLKKNGRQEIDWS